MYAELYDAWTRELQNPELEKLPQNFYARMADYIRKLREEARMLDKRTIKSRLLRLETENVKHMLTEITRTRYHKILRKASAGDKTPNEFLTFEEDRLSSGVLPLTEAYQRFAKSLLRGRTAVDASTGDRKNTVLRFTKDVPAMIGVDMKTHGPFKAEDVAALPIENSKILIKQGLAMQIDAF